MSYSCERILRSTADNAQEVSELLGERMSNQDEDEVEEELEVLEREAMGVSSMPNAPSITRNELPNAPQESPQERAKRRARERAAAERASEPIAA